MTRVTCGGYVVRVWREEVDLVLGPSQDVYDALWKVFGAAPDGRSRIHQIAEAIETVNGVAAYEILDRDGNGAVVYPDWK